MEPQDLSELSSQETKDTSIPSDLELDLKKLSCDPAKCSDAARLGSGQYGDVFKVTYKDKLVAIKVYKDAVAGQDPERRKRELLIETKALRVVQHPNVGKLIGYSLKPLCFVMEIAQRGSLLSILENKQKNKDYIDLKWSLRLWIALQIITGVNFIHSKHIIHRDLKGGNILIRDDWSVMLVDFGAAKFKDRMSVQSMLQGTVRWIAPELVTGTKTYAADIYSFAMVMYELLTREIPWKGFTENDVMEDLSENKRPPLNLKLKREAPKGYIELMIACWNQEYEKRPSSKQVIETLTPIYEAELKKEGIQPYTISSSSFASTSSTTSVTLVSSTTTPTSTTSTKGPTQSSGSEKR